VVVEGEFGRPSNADSPELSRFVVLPSEHCPVVISTVRNQLDQDGWQITGGDDSVLTASRDGVDLLIDRWDELHPTVIPPSADEAEAITEAIAEVNCGLLLTVSR
jgi:hypothetical protein